MLSVVIRVNEGRQTRPREGKSWSTIAREGWATDILRERSFLWLVGSRLFVLMGANMLINFATFYLADTFGLSQAETGGTNILLLGATVLGNVATVVPAGRISDRVGRKKVIYAACATAAAGMLIVALSPAVPVSIVGAGLFGAGTGMFLAVDWALMTDIIPKASSGRFMGISNLAVGLAGPVAALLAGPIIDFVGGKAETGEGPRAAFLAGVGLFALGAFFLRPVDPRPREERLAAEAAEAATGG
jgi:MFS family permease